MDFKLTIFIFTSALAILNAEYVSYKGHKVYKIVPHSDNDVQILIDMQNQNEHMFWTDIINVGSDVRVMVAPERQEEFEEYLTNVKLEGKIVIEDVQVLIDAQLNSASKNRRSGEYAWNYYQNLDEINDWLDGVAAAHPNVVTLLTIGSSVEGRYIRGVKIDYKKVDNSTIGMLEGGIHAREWISPATLTWIINEFLTSSDPNVRFLAENVVWHIFPVINPDGYVYTFTNNRMWRKNRNTANFTSCAQWNLNDDMSNGIDLNRNFGFLWMTVGASLNPCAETFAGPTPFSEPEAVTIANYVQQLQTQGNLVYYIAFHSFAQMVLVPYSHVLGADVLEASNYGDMYEIAIRGMDKLKERHGTNYIVGTSAEILYAVSGSSFDWVKGVAEVPIVYLFELRDVGEYGFLLPADQIIPNNEEIMDSLIEMDRMTKALGYYSYSGTNNVIYSLAVVAFGLVFLILYN